MDQKNCAERFKATVNLLLSLPPLLEGFPGERNNTTKLTPRLHMVGGEVY